MNAPAPLDRLIGRRQELNQLAELHRTTRLITIRGPGGAGKTRLALEYAQRVSTAHWVELAAVTDPALLESVIATAVGVSEQRGRPLPDTVAAALTGTRALLVLDNCEHLVDACARLVGALLTRCPDLTVLTTSRETLDVRGEVVLPLGALPGPDAVELFVARAGAAARGFALTDDNAVAVTAICGRLDGHPLSIELAARRIRILRPADILRRLDDRLQLLASSRRADGDRHRDLRSAIGWSYDLLDAEEQALFRRLSVLSGGFGLHAAAAAADHDDPVELLHSLEAKSLLVSTGSGRFRQLESIRLYAHEQLVAAGELTATRLRVIAWLTALAERYARQAFPTMDVLGPLDAERDNLLAALGWPHDRTQLITSALAACWRERGQFGPGLTLLDAVLAEPGDHLTTALAQAAVLATDVGDAGRARTLAAEAVAFDRADGKPLRLVRSTSRLAGACLAAGDARTALAHARAALVLARAHGQPFDLAVCLHNVAYVGLHVGELEEAATLLAECLPVCRTRPEPWLRVGALHSAGTLSLAQRDLRAAEAYFREALEFATKHPARKVHSIEGLAVVAASRGDGRRALRLGAATAVLRRKAGMGERRDGAWEVRVLTALAEARLGMRAVAARHAVDEGAALDADAAVAYALSERWVVDGPLTGREREITALVAEGRSSREIAARLGIAGRTVDAHLDNIRAKLGLRSRTQLAAWWARQRR